MKHICKPTDSIAHLLQLPRYYKNSNKNLFLGKISNISLMMHYLIFYRYQHVAQEIVHGIFKFLARN